MNNKKYSSVEALKDMNRKKAKREENGKKILNRNLI